MEDHVHAVKQTELTVAQNSGVAGNDYMIWDSGRGYYLLNVVLPDGTVQLFLPEDVEQAAYYGYTFDGDDAWDYDEARDSRVTQSVLALEYGVADPLIVRDEFWSGQQDFQSYVRYLPLVAVLALVLDTCTGVLLVFLFRAAGWQAGRPRPVLNWFDRIPFDALAFCAFWIIAVLINAGDSITYGLNTLELVTELWVGLGFITIGVMGTLLALCLTAAVRIRAGTFWHNNVLRMLGSLIGRGCRALARAWPSPAGRCCCSSSMWCAASSSCRCRSPYGWPSRPSPCLRCAAGRSSGGGCGTARSAFWAASRSSKSTPATCTTTWPPMPGSSTTWARPWARRWTSACAASGSRPS